MRLLVVIFSLLLWQQAEAGSICDEVGPDEIVVDGFADDWRASKKKLPSVQCAFAGERVYFFALFGETSGKSDLDLSLSVGKGKELRLRVPGPGSKRAGKGKAPKGVEIASSLQPNGVSFEVSVPARSLANWAPSVPYLQLALQLGYRNWKGKIHPRAAASSYRAFMRNIRKKNSDVTFDKLADVDTGKGPERVMVVGKFLGILTNEFAFLHLPVANEDDVRGAHLVDFDGGGRSAILVQLRQHGNGGSRDLLVAYFVEVGGIVPAAQIEIRKERDGNVIENQWSLVSPKRRRGKSAGVELRIEAGEAQGFDASNYRESPAPDAEPILLPWGEKTAASYRFNGTQLERM